MAWIKRNLGFVIGSLVALVLMGLPGFYLYSKWSLNSSIVGQLDEQYAELDRLNKLNPHPGEPGKIDNIEEAKNQQKQLRDILNKSRTHFERIAPIPDMPKVADPDFSRALSRTIDELQKQATSTSVNLPPKTAGGSYSFSFEAQKSRVSFAPGSLRGLSVQLGEVKAICDILFQAKINSLESLRRGSFSPDVASSPQAQTDYIARHSTTNELAVLSPYEITIRCFSSELAAVVAGFASSPYGLIVKTLNVEPGVTATPEEGAAATMAPAPVVAQPQPQPVPRTSTAEAERAMQSRYGPGGPSGRGEGGRPRYQPPPPVTPAPAPAPAAHGGLPTVLDEKQLKVTMTVDVVKLLPTPAK